MSGLSDHERIDFDPAFSPVRSGGTIPWRFKRG